MDCTRRLFLAIALLSVVAPSAGAAVFVTDARIERLKKNLRRDAEPTGRAWGQVEAAARAALDHEPRPPRNFYVPGYYADPKGNARARLPLQRDANAAYAAALAYRITGDADYARASLRIINAWVQTVDTLEKHDDSQLAFSYHFPAMIFAADLLDGFADFRGKDRKALREFLRHKAVPMGPMYASNNWGCWGLVLVMSCGAYLEDKVILDRAVRQWRVAVDAQMAKDGHLFNETVRNGGRGDAGIWYTNFALMPLTLAAEVALNNGTNLYGYRSPNRRSLRLGFEYVAPMVRDPSRFPFYRGDVGAMVYPYYVSYFELLNARWPNADAAACLRRLRPMSADHSAPFLTFTHGEPLRE